MLYEAKNLELVPVLERHGVASFKSFRLRWVRFLEKNLAREKKTKISTQLSGSSNVKTSVFSSGLWA